MKPVFAALLLCLFFLFGACRKSKDPEPNNNEAQLIAEVNAIDEALKSDTNSFIIRHGSGIRVAIRSFGNAPTPKAGQVLSFNYISSLFSGGRIDSTHYNGLQENLAPNGIKTAITWFPAGSAAKVYVPSLFAYGEKGNAVVPGNATLVYDIHPALLTRSESEQKQFTLDTAAIHNYLISKNIQNAVKDSTGIWYTITTPGTGDNPTMFHKINARYKGTLIGQTSAFGEGNLSNQALTGLIDGVRMGALKMKRGGSITLYIPSGLGYGSRGTPTIPADANLIFELSLTSFAR